MNPVASGIYEVTDATQYEVVELPPEIEARILAFMKTFGLIYGAFDLMADLGL